MSSNLPAPSTIELPHLLGGTTASYRLSEPFSASKPTIVLLHSFTTSSLLFAPQFSDAALREHVNLLAIDLLGHGGARTTCEQFTYWDSAWMALGVMAKLGVEKAFAQGTSQGGWVAMRMALLAPEKILGVIPCGSSMDYESLRSQKLGCWDGHAAATPCIQAWSSAVPTPDFRIAEGYCDYLIDIGLGKECAEEVRRFWKAQITDTYIGDEARRRARMAGINLRERDGLHGRLGDVKCPVLCLQGTKDVVYTIQNAEEEIKLFVNSPDARVVPIEGGHHFLSASNPGEVNREILDFVKQWYK